MIPVGNSSRSKHAVVTACILTTLLIVAVGWFQTRGLFSAFLARADGFGSNEWIIRTIAGGGSVGDGGPALNARISLPNGALIDPEGNLVISDFGNHRIRRVDKNTGIITTIAGTGEAGYNGDGIPAVQAQISRPESAAFGPDGALYIVDEYNQRIRRVDPKTGLISTVAGNGRSGYSGDGGPATEAEFHQPEGISIDPKGNIYVGDTVNARVRRIDAVTGVMTTAAGNGEIGTSPDGTSGPEASFMRIARLACDQLGNVYIPDSPAHKVQMLNVRTGKVWTVAGTGEEGDSGDGGPARLARIAFPEGVAVDLANNLYFCDVARHHVWRVDAKTRIITRVAGTGEKGYSGDGGPARQAKLWGPGRLSCDKNGNLYLADLKNDRIRFIDLKTGIITTVVGNGTIGDGGPALDAILAVPGDVAYSHGRVYVADFGNRRVRVVDLASGTISSIAGGGMKLGEGILGTEAEILLPEGITVDPAGNNLYIADNIASRVWRVDLSTGLIYPFAGCGIPGYSGDGGQATGAHLTLPCAVSVGADGTVYISDFGNYCIRSVDPKTNRIRTLIGGPGRDDRVKAVSLAASEEGLYLVAQGDYPREHYLRLLTPKGIISQIDLQFATPQDAPPEFDIVGIAKRGSTMYISDVVGHHIFELNLVTHKVRTVVGNGVQGFYGDGGPAINGSLFQPGGVAFGEPGQFFIADTKNHRIRLVQLTAESRTH